jgi:hypothetical protein
MTTPKTARIRAWLYRPAVQIVALLMVGGAWSSSLDRLGKAYRAGPDWSLGFILAHVVAAALLFLFLRIADGIEARMKAGDKA